MYIRAVFVFYFFFAPSTWIQSQIQHMHPQIECVQILLNSKKYLIDVFPAFPVSTLQLGLILETHLRGPN